MSYFIVVFSEHSIIEARVVDYGGLRYSYNDGDLNTEIPSGEYIVVHCEVGRPRENLIGITKVEARKVTVSEAVQFRDLCFLYDGTPNNIFATPIPISNLTAHQRKATIKTIQNTGYGPWWDNAPRVVKDTLQVKTDLLSKLFNRMKVGNDPKEMMSNAVNSFNETMQEMRNLPDDKPCLRIWEKVIGELTIVIGTMAYNEIAIDLRARAYYYAGKYQEAIKDIDDFFSEGHRFNPIDHGDISPKTLRAMARIGLRQFLEAENDLHEEIGRLQEFMDQQSINRSTVNYWLLVCKHKGDINAAIEEQSEFY